MTDTTIYTVDTGSGTFTGTAENIAKRLVGDDAHPALLADTIREVEYHGTPLEPKDQSEMAKAALGFLDTLLGDDPEWQAVRDGYQNASADPENSSASHSHGDRHHAHDEGWEPHIHDALGRMVPEEPEDYHVEKREYGQPCDHYACESIHRHLAREPFNTRDGTALVEVYDLQGNFQGRERRSRWHEVTVVDWALVGPDGYAVETFGTKREATAAMERIKRQEQA